MTLRSGFLCAVLGLAAATAVASGACASPVVVPPPTHSPFTTLAADLAPQPPTLAQSETMQPGAVTTQPSAADASAVPQKGGLNAAWRSLVIPGWGQAYTGHKTQAAVFGLLELGTWIAFGTYRAQGSLRQDSSFDTARMFAGIDLEGKPEELRRLVGQYQSSDVYNQYVVLREATFFIEDPDERAAYIAENSIPADQAWSWSNYDDFLRYGDQRRSSEHAYQNSRYVLGFALVNRLVSAVAAARTSHAGAKDTQANAQPGELRGRLAWDVVPGKTGLPESRLAWTMTF